MHNIESADKVFTGEWKHIALKSVSVIVENAPLDPGYILQLTCRSMLYLKKYSQTSCQFMLASANMNKYIVFTWKYGFYYITSSVHSTADQA